MPDAMEAKKKGYDMVVSFPREGVAAVIEGVALGKDARKRERATKFINCRFSKDTQDLLDKNDVYMLPTLPDASIDAAVQSLMKEAKLLPVDLEWVGKNRKRLVERWVNEVIKELAGAGTWSSPRPSCSCGRPCCCSSSTRCRGWSC